jgi:hypothetical protein
MSLAVVIVGAALIFLSCLVTGHRAGLWVSEWLIPLPQDFGAWTGLLTGLALGGLFLWQHVPLLS